MPSKLRRAAAVLVLAALAGLAGCQPREASPPPTAWPIHVQYTPAIAPKLQALHACVEGIPGAGLLVDELPADRLDPSKADLVFRFGQPATFPGFGAAIGADEVVSIVNPANPVVLTQSDLVAIFSGQLRRWSDLTPSPTTVPIASPAPIQVWSYPTGDDVREAFANTLLSGAAITPQAGLAPDPSAMLQAVAADPAAIGYLPRSQATSQVKVLSIEAAPPAAIPLLALASSEPQGPARTLLACLQK